MFYAVALHGWTCKWAMSRGSLMKSTSSPNVQENKVSSPKIQTQHIIKQCAHACMQSHFSRVRLLATPWTVAHQAPLSMGFSRQQYWSGLTCLPPWDLLNPGTEPVSLTSPALTVGFFTTRPTWEALNRISALIKEVLERYLALSTPGETAQRCWL